MEPKSLKEILSEVFTDDREKQKEDIFRRVLEYLRQDYPDRDIRIENSYVKIDGRYVMNMDGYNLLQLLTDLCYALKDELL
jgi:hypothetical protein